MLFDQVFKDFLSNATTSVVNETSKQICQTENWIFLFCLYLQINTNIPFKRCIFRCMINVPSIGNVFSVVTTKQNYLHCGENGMVYSCVDVNFVFVDKTNESDIISCFCLKVIFTLVF